MKKIIISISASAIYTLIGFMISLSSLSKKLTLSGKSYNYEFGIIDQVVDGIQMIGYDILLYIIGIPTLIAGLGAGILACIALHIYNKNYEETTACTVLSVFSLSILASVTGIYLLGIAGIFMLSL